MNVSHGTSDDAPIVKTRPARVEATARHTVWANEEATQAFAARLAAVPQIGNAFVELRGDLGAGKTTLVRHVLQALGVQGRIKSPTYAVVEPYDVLYAKGQALSIWHFDFYRFSDPREWEDAGFRDIFVSDGLKIAEWPDKAAPHLPKADLVIGLEVLDDESRQVQITAQTETGFALLAGALP